MLHQPQRGGGALVALFLQQQQALLADEAGVAAALTASFLETDRQLACDDGCTATALLLEGRADGTVLLRLGEVARDG